MMLTPAHPAAALRATSGRRLSGASCRGLACCVSPAPAPAAPRSFSRTQAVPLPCERRSSAAAAAQCRGSRSAPLRNLVTAAAGAPASGPLSGGGSGPQADPPQQQKDTAASDRKQQQPAAVIGVDFGTSGSGYMVVVLPAPGRARDTKMCTALPDSPSTGDCKTLTALLYRGTKVDSFGWTAWRRWAAMTDEERRKGDCRYVEGFKLLLKDDAAGSSSGSSGGSSSGSSTAAPHELVARGVSSQLPPGKDAKTVASDFLAELRKFTMKRLQEQRTAAAAAAAGTAATAPAAPAQPVPLDPASVLWCVTVPAMWPEAAKQNLRGAANMAGFVTAANPESLILALEPEAAAVAAIAAGGGSSSSNSSRSSNGSSNSIIEDGASLTHVAAVPDTAAAAATTTAKATAAAERQQRQQQQPHAKLVDGDVVLVVDCGGGTADITLHEVVIDSDAVGAGGGRAPPSVHLREAAVGSGIEAGGRFVDAALFELLRGHVGPMVWDEWRRLHPGEWTELAMRWETTKRVVSGAMDLQLPPGLLAAWRQQQQQQHPTPPPQHPVSLPPDRAGGGGLRVAEAHGPGAAAAAAVAVAGRRVLEGWMRKRLRWGRGHTMLQDIRNRNAPGNGSSGSSTGGSSSTQQQQQQQQQPAAPDGITLSATTGLVQLSEAVLAERVFGPVMEQIVGAAAEVEAHGRQLCGNRATKVLLAGGFGNSKLLQRRLLRMADEWGVPLLVPRDPGAVVVTGAALLGCEPSFVLARRCRRTYGVRCTAPWSVAFAESAAAFGYPQRVWRDEDRAYDADGVFEAFVHAGQLVGTDEVVTSSFCPPSSTSTAIEVDLYSTPAAVATCVGEPGMRREATVTLELPPGWRQQVDKRTDYTFQVEMRFGTSELKMVAVDTRSRAAAVGPRVDWSSCRTQAVPLPRERRSAAAAAAQRRGSRSAPLRNLVTAAAGAPASSSLSGGGSSGPQPDPPQQQKDTAAAAGGDHKKQQPAAVVGVDFGTWGSGYAAILAPYHALAAGAQPPPILCCGQWPDDPSSGEVKTRTALLYRGSKVEAWGWTAWKRWSEMPDSERRAGDYCYLQDFKLLLYPEGAQQQGGAAVAADPQLAQLDGSSQQLPPGKTAVGVAADFLAELRRFTFKRLQAQYAKASAAAAANNSSSSSGGGGGTAPPSALEPASVVWCVTVPAMWPEAAKKHVRSAANRAGMAVAANPGSLFLALEPEAAAVAMALVNRMRRGGGAAAEGATSTKKGRQGDDDLDIAAGRDGSSGGLRPVTEGGAGGQKHKGGAAAREERELVDGDVVLVVDCGGGTADITLHEVEIDEAQGDTPMILRLKEAAVGKGVLAGGRFVDAAMFELLRGRVGAAVWDEWRRLHPGEWTDLESKWEGNKKKMGAGGVDLQMPPALMAAWQQRQQQQGRGQQQADRPGMTLSPTTGMVQLSRELLRTEVFGPVMEKIAAAAAEVEAEGRQVRGKPATKMLLAGGFANSALLQERMRELERQLGVPLLAPPVPGTVVVTGALRCAALLAAQPGLVTARRCRQTYGIRCRALWSSEEAESAAAFGYPQRIWKPEDAEYYADGVFETFARRGQLVGTDESVKRTFCPTSSSTTAIAVDVYATPAAEARYIGEPGMRRVAEVTLELPPGWRKGVAKRTDYDVEVGGVGVEIKFGAVELTVLARDPRTRNAVAARFDWL
ncbi:hypothetical protein HXX76_005084 [Chlamydomonas incerta]|uniref:Uncharacterized protein n=1 Tax=Chlamydomonas incerta TaxID=51695 RepID=A0A835T4B5_CHLIN|nr:hypothetical protein HXX76_005084 [Chlamydomonas incerta]|eukprot:KAG2438533.1 hypothetical protein HXX76_005084 [Chlamydomonas incerta]